MKRVCKQCGREFYMAQSEVSFYKGRNLQLPKRCKECREAKKQQRKEMKGDGSREALEQWEEPLTQEKESGQETPKQRMRLGQEGISAQETPPRPEELSKKEKEPKQERSSMPGKEERSGQEASRQDGKGNHKKQSFIVKLASAAAVLAMLMAGIVPGSAGDSAPAAVVTESVAEPGLTFRSSEHLEDHYQKHGIEMGFASAEEYQAVAAAVVGNAAALHKTEAEDGDDVYYIESTNEFVIVSTDGYIRTYFYPDAGMDYYNRQ